MGCWIDFWVKMGGIKKYKILDKVAIADIAFEAYGKDYNELFQNCALALFEMAVDISTLNSIIKKEIKLEADSIENLLYDFLSEVLYLKDAEQLIFAESYVEIQEKSNKYQLMAILKGDEINAEMQKLENDIKAITMHMFKIEKARKGYKATVVVDI